MLTINQSCSQVHRIGHYQRAAMRSGSSTECIPSEYGAAALSKLARHRARSISRLYVYRARGVDQWPRGAAAACWGHSSMHWRGARPAAQKPNTLSSSESAVATPASKALPDGHHGYFGSDVTACRCHLGGFPTPFGSLSTMVGKRGEGLSGCNRRYTRKDLARAHARPRVLPSH